MKCKSCGREIEDNSMFCNWCGEKQIKARKKKDEIKIPAPRQLASGSWRIYLDAEKQSITDTSKEKCIAKAKAIRAGFLEKKKRAPKLTVEDAIKKMIHDKDGVISPSTIRGYDIALRHGFKKYMKCDISAPIDWQEAIKEEAALVSAKTVFNRWNVISAAMRHVKVTPPDVTLPKFKKGGQPYLDFEQIRAFIPLIRGTTCEVAALLALHSLRLSELVNLKGRDIVVTKRGAAFINVSGSRVLDKNNKLIEKDTNKTYESTREIPVVIPRLLDILPDVSPDDYIVKLTPQAIGKQINKICKANDLPLVSVHGLRRSFASLGYHLGWPELRTMKFGGWTNIKTVHEHYLHEAQKDMDKSTKKMQKFYTDIEKCSK